MLQEKLKVLAANMNLTNLDDEPLEDILTAEEKELAIRNAIQSLKDFYLWRRVEEKKEPLHSVERKMAEIRWEVWIDPEEVLKKANTNKHSRVWEQGRREKEKQEEITKVQNLKELWTAENMFKFMRGVCDLDHKKKLTVDAENKKLITAICFFLSDDPRFETELNFSFSKGLIIRGVTPGLGKTFLIDLVKKNGLNPILIFNMIDIYQAVVENGEFELPVISKGKIFLDDVGTEEPTVNHYGTRINWFKEFIEVYYHKNFAANKLIISTNCTFKQFEDKYGFRVRSRMKDMFNVIDVKGTDRRGKGNKS